jgi:hypothetical protein
MSGWIFLGLGLAVGLVDFIVGLRWSRMTVDQLAPNPDGSHRTSAEPLNRIGRLAMICAPLFLFILALIGFGIIPVAGIDPISFN